MAFPKHQMKCSNQFLGNEQGFVLVLTMLILVALTLVGIAALDTSTFEVRIAANDRWAKLAFNLADGSVYSTSKLVSEALEGDADPDYGSLVAYTGFTTVEEGIAVPNNADDFYSVVKGYKDTQTELHETDPVNFPDDPVPDFQATPDPNSPEKIVEVYIVSREAKQIAGGGAEFGAGAAGAGYGASGGGAAILFDVDIDGFAGDTSRSAVSARFRKVLGSVGGL